MRFTFVHAADLHLDSPLRSLSAAEPLAGVLRAATFGAFERIVSLCLERKAELLVLSGDLFDARDRSVRARLALRAGLEALHQGGVRTFIVHGNHDPLTEDVRALALPPSVHVFGARWEEVMVRREDAVLCRVQGISYPQEKMTSDLSHYFKRRGPELTIGALHCNLSAFPGHVHHANYAPCTPADLGDRGLDYWALGHVHNHGETELPGGGVAVYPGNPQGRHPKEAGPKGCVVVEVDGLRTKRTFVPVDQVRWHEVPVDIASASTIDALVEQVVARVVATCEEVSTAEGRALKAHAVRVTLEGAGPLHAEVAAKEALAELERVFRDALAARSSPIALEWLVERTRPALDLKAIRRRGGLSAEVLQAEGTPWPQELKALDLQLQRAGLTKLAADPERLGALMESARQRALELLEEGVTA
ncbi:MAG TPA: DNA repair exonuclease [Myxococcaceae bacterium]|nr:DNA repair exonuclease [Myxococcaceae bacterium]